MTNRTWTSLAAVTTTLVLVVAALLVQTRGSRIQWTAVVAGRTTGGPRLDVGTVRTRDRKRIGLALHNHGDTAIRVVRTYTTCGCLAIRQVSESSLALPNGRVRFELTVDVTGYRPRGFSQRVFFRLLSNGREWTETYTVSGHASSGVRVEQELLNFGTIQAGERARAVLSFTDDGAVGEWTVTSIRWLCADDDSEPISFTMHPGKTLRGKSVQIAYPPIGINGIHERDLLILTTHPDLPRLVIPSRISVQGGVAVEPPRILLGRCRIGQPGSWFEVSVSGGNDLKIEGVLLPGISTPASLLDLSLLDGPARLRARYSGDGGIVDDPATPFRIAGIVILRIDGKRVAVPFSGTLWQ